jgi:hypothetical protein
MATLTDAFLADLDDLSDGSESQQEKAEDVKDVEVIAANCHYLSIKVCSAALYSLCAPWAREGHRWRCGEDPGVFYHSWR